MRPPSPLRIGSTLGGYLRLVRRSLVVICVLSVMSSLLEAASFASLAAMLARLTGGDAHATIGPVDFGRLSTVTIGLVAFVAVVVAACLQVVVGRREAATAGRVLSAVRSQLLGAYLRGAWLDQQRAADGRLQELVSAHGGRVALATLSVTDALSAAVTMVTLVATAAGIDPVTTGVFAVIGVIGVLLMRPLGRNIRGLGQEQVRSGQHLAAVVTDTVRLAREVRLLGVTDPVEAALQERLEDVSRSYVSTKQVQVLAPVVFRAVVVLMLVVGVGVIGELNVGSIAQTGAAALVLIRALTYAQQLQAATQQLKEQAPFVDAIDEEVVQYLAAPGVTAPAVPSAAGIRITGATLGYPTKVVLDDVDLEIAPDAFVGIVGPSGAGKTTLTQSILGLLPPLGGTVEVGGTDPFGVMWSPDRPWFGYVGQDPVLVAGTVAENIRFFRTHVSDDEVRRAARAAGLDEELIDVEVGIAGGSISGGQRQRVALARALVGSPPVLILDEVTSALDGTTAAAIMATFESLRGTATVIAITHNPELVRLADVIVTVGDRGVRSSTQSGGDSRRRG